MKGKEIITHAVRAEMPDMEQLRENSMRQAETTVKRAVWVKRLVPAAACLAVVLAAVIAFPHFISKTITGAEKGDVMKDRILLKDFSLLLEYGAENFAVVRITDTKIKKDWFDRGRERQVSDAYVLQNLYNECGSDILQITQLDISVTNSNGPTFLLREGGVYLLPLRQIDEKWYVVGDNDVLFEADYTGKVWSHSDYEDFNRYDGKNIEYLMNDLKEMFSDEDFMLAHSTFSRMLSGWILADITVLTESDKKKDEYGNRYFSYTFTVNEILSDPSRGNKASFKETDSIMVFANEADAIDLTPQKRYLIGLGRSSGKINVSYWAFAEIENDETITVKRTMNETYFGKNDFLPYDGYTLSEIRELIPRIEAWRETHNGYAPVP